MVTEEDLSVGRLYPPLANIREISVKIAKKVAEEAYEAGTASTYPEPEVQELILLIHYVPSVVGQGVFHSKNSIQLQL